MSVLSLLAGGKKPQRIGPSAEEAQIGREAQGLHAAADRFSEVVDRGNWDLARGRVGARADALGAVSADVAQAFAGPATSASGALGRALTRGRGLTRLVNARADQFDSQLLRDRVAAVGHARARQGLGLGAMADVASLNKRLEDARLGTKKVGQEGRANVFGTVAGMGLGALANRGTLFPGKQPKDDGGILDSSGYRIPGT